MIRLREDTGLQDVLQWPRQEERIADGIMIKIYKSQA